MLHAYLNYPNSRASVHGDSSCGHLQQMGKKGQRVLRLDLATVGAELNRFASGQHRFASTASHNDMWLEIQFEDPDFEIAVVRYVHRLLGHHYRPFGGAVLEQHCRGR